MRVLFGFPLAIIVSFALIGCSVPFMDRGRPKPVPSMTPVSVSQTNIATIAKGVLAGLEATAASYVLSGSASGRSQREIATAEVVAENIVNSLGTVSPGDFPDVLRASSRAVKVFTGTIPPGRIPPSVIAGLSAYMGFADVMAPILRNPDTPVRIVP